MVEESKNERLKMLLDKTNELLEGIGKAVQRQKDAEHVSQPEGAEVPKGSESEDNSQISDVKNESPGESPSDDDADLPASVDERKFNAGRRLDFTVHSIEEKVQQCFTIHLLNFLCAMLLGVLALTVYNECRFIDPHIHTQIKQLTHAGDVFNLNL
jgi:hypothetical protein